MNARLGKWMVLSLASVVLSGCAPNPAPVPKLDRLEQVLGVSFLSDSKVIGGSDSSGSSGSGSMTSGSTFVCLIASSEPLPLPVGGASVSRRRLKQAKRPQGTDFPVSALLNLMASCDVSEGDVPELAGKRGTAHVGQVEGGQYCYREAPTVGGWLTAVEIQLD